MLASFILAFGSRWFVFCLFFFGVGKLFITRTSRAGHLKLTEQIAADCDMYAAQSLTYRDQVQIRQNLLCLNFATFLR